MEPEKKLMEMIERVARMAKNHARMRMVWEDVRLGPEPDDPSRYIASLCCLREMAGQQIDLLASGSVKMGELVAYACECAQAAAKLTTEIDGGEKNA